MATMFPVAAAGPVPETETVDPDKTVLSPFI